MFFRPIPTVKLSILTEKAYIIIFNKEKSYFLSSFDINSTNISIAIKTKIINNNLSGFTTKNRSIDLPKIDPNNGIKKWKYATIHEKRIHFLLLILKVPKLKDKEKVSIDKDIPIKISNKIFILNYIL